MPDSDMFPLAAGTASSGAAASTDGGATWSSSYGSNAILISNVPETVDPAAVPEPGAAGLLVVGSLGLGMLRRRGTTAAF